MVKKWQNFPEKLPKDVGRCLVELCQINDLGKTEFLWFCWWNGESFDDYAGCNDLKKGSKVIRFIEEVPLREILS